MAIDRVKEYFKQFNKENDILEFPVSSATVAEAAEAIGCKEGDIAKTLSFLIDEQPILIVVAGDKKVDNHKYKECFHKKAKMIPFEELNTLIGHEAGGICPFGINDGVDVYLDVSLKEYEYVYPACGSSNSAIKLSLAELEKYSNYKEWVDVTK